MKRSLLAALLVVSCAAPVSAASFKLDILAPYLSAQYYTWEEESGGSRILRERGPMFGAGVVAGGVTDSSVTLRLKAEIFGSQVEYDGQTQGATPVPINTDVTYIGTLQEFDAGYRAGSGDWRIEPFAGVGHRWWIRDLHDTTTSSGEPVAGYSEHWQTAYARLGARGRYLVGSGASVFAEAGAKYPFYTGNSVDFTGYGTTTFHPEGRWSGFAEVGGDLDRLKLTLFYQGLRYAQSPLKQVGTRLFYQPDSSSDVFGLNVGWSFR